VKNQTPTTLCLRSYRQENGHFLEFILIELPNVLQGTVWQSSRDVCDPIYKQQLKVQVNLNIFKNACPFQLQHADGVPRVLSIVPYYAPRRTRFKNTLVRKFLDINNLYYFMFHDGVLYTRWFKYDRDCLWVNLATSVPVIFEPPCMNAIVSILTACRQFKPQTGLLNYFTLQWSQRKI